MNDHESYNSHRYNKPGQSLPGEDEVGEPVGPCVSSSVVRSIVVGNRGVEYVVIGCRGVVARGGGVVG